MHQTHSASLLWFNATGRTKLNVLNWTSTTWNKNGQRFLLHIVKTKICPELSETNRRHLPFCMWRKDLLKGEQRSVQLSLSRKRTNNMVAWLRKRVRNMAWCIHICDENQQYSEIHGTSGFVWEKWAALPLLKENSRHRSGHPTFWSKVDRIAPAHNWKFRNIDPWIHF